MSEPEYITISLDEHINWLLDSIETEKRYIARLKDEHNENLQYARYELRLLREELVESYKEQYEERHGS